LKKLEESEKQFRLMAELMPQKIWTSDAVGNKNYFNKTLLDYVGIPGEALKGRGWKKIIHPDDRKRNEEVWQQSVSTGNDYEAENRLLRKDGVYLWHLTRAVALRDEDGRIKGWVGSKTEIQEQKEQKEVLEKSMAARTFELKEANQELELKHRELFITKEKLLTEYSRSLIEASLDPLVTINTEGKVTDMNQATINITGISREKLTGSDFFDYFTEPQKARTVYEQVFANGSIANSPLTLRHTDNKLTDVLLNGSVYKDGKGKVQGVVLVARDVTEEKRIATELTEAIVFAELATGMAEDAKAKAEDAVKAKQQFLSNMSHEIRTPMNAIIGFTKVVLKTELNVKQREYLNAIKQSGNSMIVLINDILDLAKVDAGKMTFEKMPFKLESSISAMVHLFEAKIEEKNLKLIKDYDKHIPEVLLGDPVRLHQIILNLVSNAVKFTAKGNITIAVKLLKEDQEHATIEFAISDTGIGISEGKLETIFENFQQASSGTSRLYGGTGLGLAIVKQLVEGQHGTIQVQSKPEAGSTFRFTLAFQKTNDRAEPDTELLELDTELKHIKVLVVEDMALNQLLMKTLLDDFGFERDIAANGKIAIEKLAKKNYDIVLMDLQMPEMNGFEATEHIRNTMRSTIPIIALTADVTTVDLEKCKAVGMNDYIAKPVDERVLYSKIIGLVKKPVQKIYTQALVDETNKTPASKCTDLAYLIGITKNDPQLMMEMIGIYLEQTPKLIESMKQSLLDKDWDTLYAAAHKMIPSFAIMGIHADYEAIAKKVQAYAAALSKQQGIQELVQQLENVCVQACKELQEEFSTLKYTQS
jgi:PAS domain S-box-containing protein